MPSRRSGWISRSGAVILLGLLTGASLGSIGPLPRVGPLLDPVRGVWSVAGQAVMEPEAAIALTGLSGPVTVVVDDRGVPHLYGATELDVYRVMGYLVARDRLFQLEIQTRAGEGTLTGLVGPRALEADRAVRELGMAWGAERKFAALDTSNLGYRAIVAYADGVNQYLDAMGPDDLPLEYHLLGRRPRRFEPVHSAYLFARMGYTLASQDPAPVRLLVQSLVGVAAAEALVPLNNPIQEPIQPTGRVGPRYGYTRLPPPGTPDSAAAVLAAVRPQFAPDGSMADGGAVGSNNWAVAPARTLGGHAILAGDPHLELTLPSIWYEAHLVVPGQLDAAGVSLPGAPGIVIGFNRHLAWTFTNTGGDVLDIYRETVDRPEAPGQYRLDGGWQPLRLREEVYRDPNGSVIAVDTIRFTHRGPVVRRGDTWFSARWTVNERSAEIDLSLRAAKTETASEWLAVMSEYVAPTQNGLVADQQGTIAIRSSGVYPVRPGDGRGDLIRDGSTAASDWTGILPVDRYPQAINPAQGFLVSANQQPVDPLDNPSYLGADWISPWRALRINALVRAEPAMTPDRMRQIQTDPGSARADAFVPYFLSAVGSAGPADSTARQAAALLAAWDRHYTPDNRMAVLFEMAMDELSLRTWDELTRSGESRPAWTPQGSTLIELLADSTSSWWDDRRTADQVETRDAILRASLAAAFDDARARHGAPGSDGWAWGRVTTANINHLLRLPALSALKVPVNGGPSTIAPTAGRGVHGASWRMVVELGDTVQAMATYPGGQSGNPASPFYANRIPQWASGQLDTVLVPASADALPASRVMARWTFTPK